MIQVRWMDVILYTVIVFCIGAITGCWYTLGRMATNSGTTSNIASTSAQIPVETIKYIKVYIHDGSNMIEASKATIPIVPTSSSMKVKGEFFEADVQCVSSGTVEATIYNNQVYAASGTTYILQTASWSERSYTNNLPQWGIGGSIDFGFNPGIVGLHYDRVWGFSVTEGVQIDKTGGRGMFVINF